VTVSNPSLPEESYPDKSDLPGPAFKAKRWERRLLKIREEVERNRRGEPQFPTWLLAVVLVVLVGGVVLLIALV
jgi:hypothetical protein